MYVIVHTTERSFTSDSSVLIKLLLLLLFNIIIIMPQHAVIVALRPAHVVFRVVNGNPYLIVKVTVVAYIVISLQSDNSNCCPPMVVKIFGFVCHRGAGSVHRWGGGGGCDTSGNF